MLMHYPAGIRGLSEKTEAEASLTQPVPPRRPMTPGAAPIPPRSPSRSETRQIILLEHGSGATRLNTGKLTDLAYLAAALLANLRTLRIPPSEGRERPSDDWWAEAKATRPEHRAAYAYRDRIRKNWSIMAIIASSTTWNPIRRVDGGSTSSSPTKPP
jgi:hypothetical protein